MNLQKHYIITYVHTMHRHPLNFYLIYYRKPGTNQKPTTHVRQRRVDSHISDTEGIGMFNDNIVHVYGSEPVEFPGERN